MSGAQPSPEWMDSAACAEYPGELWYPEPSESGTEAKRICQSCPVREKCLTWALETGEPWGIWGGLGPGTRNRLRAKTPTHHNVDKTHCQRNHEFDEANTLVKADGRRQCRKCQAASSRRSHAKRAA